MPPATDTSPPDGDFTFADVLADLKSFRDDLRADPASIPDKYTCHKTVLELDPHTYGAADVKRVRAMLSVSQTLFAQYIGVSPSTVRSWERGESPPSGVACRLMDEITASPDHFRTRLRGMLKPKRNAEPAEC